MKGFIKLNSNPKHFIKHLLMPKLITFLTKPPQPDPHQHHHRNTRTNIHLTILLLTLIITLTNSFNIKQLDVSADTYIIGTLAKYTILYDRTQQNFGITNDINANPVPSTATLTLTVPSVYTFDYTITLSAVVNGGASVFPNYTISSNIITVNNLFASTPLVSTVSIIIQNLRNPSPAIITDAFVGFIGIDYAEPISLKSVVVLQPAQFQSCYMTFNPKFVNRTASMIFTIIPRTSIPANGGLQIQFPSNLWSEGTATSTTNYLPITTSMSCGNISSNVKSTIQCRGTQNQNRITVSNLFSSSINSGQSFSFQVKNFLSPPSNRPADLIKITSQDSSANKINICSQYVTDLIPNEMSPSKITITNGGLPLTVNLQYTIRFMFQTVDSFALSDYFEIEFPSGSNFTFNPNVLSGGITLVRTNATYSSNTLRCYMNPLLSVKNYSSPFTMFISAGTYTAPPSIQPTGNFKISIMRNGFPLQVGFQSLTPIATTMSGSLTGRGSEVVNRITSFTFSITINDALSSTGKIRLRLPAEVQIGSNATACATITGTNMIQSPFCVINLLTKTIELTSINSSSSLIPAQTFTVVINNLVNPFSTALTSTFEVRSFYRSTDASLVAVGTISGFVSKEATIDASNVIIQASSYRVLDMATSYTVRLNVENEIDVGGTLNLFIPKPIGLNTAVLTSSCKRAVNTPLTTTTPCSLLTQDGTGYLIRFSNPLSASGIVKGQYIILEISSIITNPPSTSPVSSFKLYTFAASGSIIAKIQSSLSIQMTDPTTLSTATYTRDSSKNYDLTSYQFTIKQVPVMEINSVVIIEFPSEIIPNVSSACGMTAPFINANLLCSLVNSSAIRITLPASIPISSGSSLTLTISNIRNPTSFRPPGDFFVRTFTSGQTYKYAEGKTSNIINNTIESSFKQVTGSYTPGQLDTATTLTISFQPAFQAPGFIQVSIPQYFVVSSSLTCSQVANFNGTCTSVTLRTLRVSGTFTSNGVTTFQVSGFTSTIRPPTSTAYVILASFTADNYPLDYSNDKITYNLDCQLPCRTCDTVNTSLCKSCYSNSAITDKLVFDSNTASCYSKCPSGKFQNPTTLLCEDCDLNCLTCERSPTFCTTCKQSSAFKYLFIKSVNQQICVSQCQQMMYPDSTKTPPTCVSCVTPCKTCTTLSFCLTCLDTFYFWNNTCTKSCPLGNTVGDNTTGNCELCSTNCLTCAGTVNTCTTCKATLILYNGQCISQCLLPLVYRPEILTCGPCDTQCKTCQKTASNCTSCDPVSLFKYFFNNNCLKQCPDRYYQTVSSCDLCSNLNRNCDFCINSTYCQKCNLGFVAFGGDCLATTPSGYVNISGIAESCQQDCATCQVTRTNCTSCKTLNLLGNTCQSTCPATTIALNKKCTSCQSPCRTCSQNINNCTSCNTTIIPTLYLIQNRCQTQCPQFFYPDNGTNKCLLCQIPCQKCTSLTSCITCRDNYFLYQGRNCISACPLQFIGINKICQPCRSPCKTCVDSPTKCLSCDQDYFFFNSTNSCVTDCGQGLYEQYLNRTCISCTTPCKTCTNTTNTCLSCLKGILYNSQCIMQCPRKMYNDTNICVECPVQCAACTSKVVCTNCTSSYVLHNSFCISKCPDTHAVIVSGVCTKCSSSNCHKCYDNDVCYNCVSDFSLLNGACLGECPAGFKTNGTHCEQVLSSTLESTNSNMFPVPLSIASSVVLIACMMSKLQNHKTFLAGAIYSLLGIIQTLALLYYIYLYYLTLYTDYPIGIYIAVGSLGLLYILNVLSIIQSIILCYDKKHSQWKDSSAMNKFYNTFSTLIGIFVSHKFKNLMFSRLFAFVVFSAPLDDVKKFKVFNIFSFISLISSGGAIFSVITIIKLVDPKTQFFHACLDIFIVTGINILIAFFNAFKGDDFFNQLTPQGLMLNRVIFGDEDSYNAKISMDGNDIQVQQGQGYYSKIQHTLGSHQPLKFKQSDQSRQDLHDQYDSDSLTNIQQKQFQSVSVQAYDMLNQKQPQQTRLDFSTLKVNQNDSRENSKFTTIFQNQDKSIQNTIDYGRKKVDYSVQKYDEVSLVDKSMQGNPAPQNNDISIQYSNKNNLKDVSIQRSRYDNNQHDVSVQGSLDRANHNDISVQNSAKYADQSGQYSFMQSQKGVQNMVLLNDRSIQQSVKNQSWGGQNTIDLKDISVQKESEQIEYNQFDQTLEQNDETVKNVDNIFYIDEDEQQEDFVEEGLQSIPQSGKKLLNMGKKKGQDQTNNEKKTLSNDNKKTITRQQLPQEKEQDFDFPPEQIKSYEEELQQKILAKKKQLQRVRKQIQQKEKESELKERIMKQQKEKVQRELKQSEMRTSMIEEKNNKQQERLRQELKGKEEQLKKEQAQKQQLLEQRQKGRNKQLEDKSTMMRMVQQVDEATSIDHGNVNHQSMKIQINPVDTQQQKEQTLNIINQPDQPKSLDEQQIFLQGLSKPHKTNYQVDMNMYIKQKSQYELNDDIDENAQSIKTKARSNNNKRKNTINNQVNSFDRNQQIQVKSSKQPSPLLNLQNQQNMDSINSNHLNRPQKEPGKIRVFQDSFKRGDQSHNDYQHTKNYIYQIQDTSLQQDESGSIRINHNNLSNVQTHKKHQSSNLSPNEQANLPLNSKQLIQRQQKYPTRQQPHLILDETNADKELNDQPANQFLVHENDDNLEELNHQQFDSSQDIPAGVNSPHTTHNQKHTQSDAEQYIHKKRRHINDQVLKEQQELTQSNAQNLTDHQQLRRAFNDQRKKLQHSNSGAKKLIPPENKQTLHVNITKLNAYQVDKPINQRSSNSISPNKKSSSLLANAANNLVGNSNDPKEKSAYLGNQNDMLIKKSSSNKNPLVTQKKWEHQNSNNLHSIQQSSEGNNDSQLYQATKNHTNIPKPLPRRQPPTVPLQTDKQQTSFSHQAIKIGSNNNLNNQPSSKSINPPQERRKTSVQKLSARELLGQNSYGEQVEVYFQTKEHEEPRIEQGKRNLVEEIGNPKQPNIGNQLRRPNVNQANSQRPLSTSKQRPYILNPPNKPGTVMKQYESQQIFGDQYQPSQQDDSQVNSFDKRLSKQHRNNMIMDKMMQRPQNDDLYQYYNRASTKKGSNKKRNSRQRGSGSKNKQVNTRINLSKEKLDNDRKMERIYMQRLDSSMNNYQRNSSRSKGRY